MNYTADYIMTNPEQSYNILCVIKAKIWYWKPSVSGKRRHEIFSWNMYISEAGQFVISGWGNWEFVTCLYSLSKYGHWVIHIKVFRVERISYVPEMFKEMEILQN